MLHTAAARRGRALALAALGMIFLGSSPSSEKRILVYVAPAGPVVAQASKAKAKELADSAADLRREIKKRQHLTLAEDAASADIVILIVDRRLDMVQNRQDYGGGHIQNHYESRHVLVYRLQTAEEYRDAEQIGAGSLVTWRSVAKDLSKHIERWARHNRDQLLGRRGQRR